MLLGVQIAETGWLTEMTTSFELDLEQIVSQKYIQPITNL